MVRCRRPATLPPLLAAVLLAAATAVAAPHASGDGVHRPPGWVRAGRGAVPPSWPTWESLLFARLAEGDRRWLPRLTRLPDGRIGYVQLRRHGEPALSIPQMQALMRNPPRYEREHRSIRANLSQLRRLGVRVQLHSPQQPRASGEWNPRSRTLRIRPDVPSSGSRQFATVLNHEAIHVAQSCRGGGVTARPMPLGLSRDLGQEQRSLLASGPYRGQPASVRLLEEEAFAHQHALELGPALLARHCGAAAAPPARLGR